jgi:hypothetical protein
VNNPYKKISGGSLDQALFKKRGTQSNTVSPSLTEQPPSSSISQSSKDQQVQNASNQKSAQHPIDRSTDRPIGGPAGRPNGRRIPTRRAFEIFEDQINALRQLSYQEKMNGGLGSMSNMVREAIDEYLNKRKSS